MLRVIAILIVLAMSSPALGEPPPDPIQAVVTDTLARTGAQVDVSRIRRADVACLASTIYGEGRGDSPDRGVTAMSAWADVIMNRVTRLRRSVCAVVQAPMQFQGYGHPIREIGAWAVAVEIAVYKLSGLLVDRSGGATIMYDHTKVQPEWAGRMIEVKVIAGHRLMKEPAR